MTEAPRLRDKPKTLPPPAPGSAARAALETAMLDVAPPNKAAARSEPRTKPPTAPPPGRPKGITQPPPVAGPAPLTSIASAPSGRVALPRAGRVTGEQPVVTSAPVEVPAARSKPTTQPPPTPTPRTSGVTGPQPVLGAAPTAISEARSKPTTRPPPPPPRTGRLTGPQPTVSAAPTTIPETRSKPTTVPPPAPPTFFGQPVGNSHLSAPPRRDKPTTTPPTALSVIPSAASQAIKLNASSPAITIASTSTRALVDATAVDADAADHTEQQPKQPPADDGDAWALVAPPAATPPTPPARPRAAPRLETEEIDLVDAEPDEPAVQPVAVQRSGGVPTGEFEHGGATVLDNDVRREQSQRHSTVKRDIANALLGIPEPPPPIPVRPPAPTPPTVVVDADEADAPAPALETVPFDLVAERGDPTTSDVLRHGAGALDSSNAHGKLRAAATLRRKRGLGGDLRYVFTVLFGVRAARAELGVLEVEQVARRSERRRNLVTLGRTAVITELEHPALEAVSERLSAVEEERAGHAGQVAAADQELTRVRRDREAKIKQHATDVAAVEAELLELGKRQDPLERELHTIKKRASSVYDALQSIDRRIAEAETSKTSMRSQKVDPASIQADIATLRADRKAVERDEPMVAAEQDALMPRIASLEAARNDARTRRARLDEDEAKDQRRVAELLEAIGAKRKVVDRAAGDAETLRDDLLFELGEALYVDRPRRLAAQLAPVDTIDLELGTGDRRVMELREILSNVDKWKLTRGIAVIALIAAAIAGIVFLLVLLSA